MSKRSESDTDAPPLPEPPIPMEGPETFTAHTLRWLRVALTEQVAVGREQIYLLRDIRDELVLMRKARENGHG